MRLKAYYDIDSGANYYDTADRSSMLPALNEPGTYDVKIIRADDTVYWASNIVLTKAADHTYDKVTADWSTASVTIPLGEQIKIEVSGITNPPTDTEIKNYYLVTRGLYSARAGATTYMLREDKLTDLTNGVAPCAHESSSASVNALVGHDRISLTGANTKYRFRFKTTNIHPKKSGF